eukprot:COSAG04_NODE_2533_length_3968_cov_2.130783_1_plen_286_part_10
MVKKLRLLKHVLGKTDTANGEASMEAAYTRFRLGLATDSDHKDLADFVDQLAASNEHIRAGKRLWKSKRLVTHLDTEEMQQTLAEIEEQLPKSDALGYHFTDLDAARVILDESQGLRASSVGQLGGGVSICLASLTDMGWSKHGERSHEFSQRVGDELWGSKAYEVLPGSPPAGAHPNHGKYHNKLEVVLLVRIPSAANRDQARIVPGRDNVYIIPQSDCVPGHGGDTARYYSNQNIERCFVLKAPSGDAACRDLEALAARDNARVQMRSERDENHGMINVDAVAV